MRNIFIASGLLALVAMGCAKKEQPGDALINAGIAASNAWLGGVDDERYGESWERASAYLRNVVSKEQWKTQVAEVRDPLGPVLSRELAIAKCTTKLPGALDGEYIVVQYRTEFQNKDAAVETVTQMRGRDGVFRTSGYYVRGELGLKWFEIGDRSDPCAPK